MRVGYLAGISSLLVGFQYTLRDVEEFVADIYIDWAM
jgi:hypothetical protein